jgi:hypothetical protein
MTQVCQPKKNSLRLQSNYTVVSEAQLFAVVIFIYSLHGQIKFNRTQLEIELDKELCF